MSDELEQRTKKIIDVELEKRKKEQEVEKYLDQSFKDPLTGLFNRNKMNQILPILVDSFRTKDEVFSIIYLDIDHFKSINDTFGHLKGGEVLKKFTSILKKYTREGDIVVRMGGEEFLIVIQKPLENAKKVAEYLRATVENTEFPIERKVTCSFGITQIEDGDNQESLIHRADNAPI